MEVDFYELGKKEGKNALISLRKELDKCEDMYGKEARDKFEEGIINALGSYQFLYAAGRPENIEVKTK